MYEILDNCYVTSEEKMITFAREYNLVNNYMALKGELYPDELYLTDIVRITIE